MLDFHCIDHVCPPVHHQPQQLPVSVCLDHCMFILYPVITGDTVVNIITVHSTFYGLPVFGVKYPIEKDILLFLLCVL